MGTVLSNCIFTDIYQTNSPEVCLFQVAETKSKVIVVDTYKRLKEKFLDKNADELVKLGVKACFIFAEGLHAEQTGYFYKSKHLKIFNWSQIMELGSEIEDRVVY